MAQPRKTCRECKRRLVYSRFWKDAKNPDGRSHRCRDCRNASVVKLTATERLRFLEEWEKAPYQAAVRVLKERPALMKSLMEQDLLCFTAYVKQERAAVLGGVEKLLKQRQVVRPLSPGEVIAALLENAAIKKV